MGTSETFSLAGKLNKLCLKNQTGTGGYLMFGIVNKRCWIYIFSKIFVSFLLVQSTDSDIRVGLRVLKVQGYKWGAAVWFGQAAICWLASGNRSNSWALQKHVFLFFWEAPALSANTKKLAKSCFGVTDFIGTWKRNALKLKTSPVSLPAQASWCFWKRLSSYLSPNRSCSPSSVLKPKKHKKSFWAVFILPGFHYTFLLAGLCCLCRCWGLQGLLESSCWASPKLLAPAPGLGNGQTLEATFVPKKSRLLMWPFSFFSPSVCQYFSRVLCITLFVYGLASYWDLGSLLVYCSLSHFHMTFCWRPEHFLGRVLDSTFLLNLMYWCDLIRCWLVDHRNGNHDTL